MTHNEIAMGAVGLWIGYIIGYIVNGLRTASHMRKILNDLTELRQRWQKIQEQLNKKNSGYWDDGKSHL